MQLDLAAEDGTELVVQKPEQSGHLQSYWPTEETDDEAFFVLLCKQHIQQGQIIAII